MKKTLTIISLLFALAGAGQKDTTAANWITYDTSTTRLFIYNDTTSAPKYDTLPILYLYADTARMMSVMPSAYILNGKLFEVNDTTYYSPDNKTYWDFGYEVIADGDFLGYTVHPITGVLKPVYERKSIGYLDRHKQPIRKSIIVWQVKQIQ